MIDRTTTLAVLAIAVMVTACTARIDTYQGSAIEGRIVGGDDRALYVDSDKGPIRVERERIETLRHPGEVSTTVGGILIGLSAISFTPQRISLGAPADHEIYASIGGLVVGATMLTWGLLRWVESSGRTDRPPPPRWRFLESPTVPAHQPH